MFEKFPVPFQKFAKWPLLPGLNPSSPYHPIPKGYFESASATQAQQEAAAITSAYVSPGVQHYHPSAAKAWVNFNGTGTIAIRSGYNVTSITDNGVGNYTVNMTNPMADANYCIACGQGYNATGNAGSSRISPGQIDDLTTSSFRLFHCSQAGSALDIAYAMYVVYGDM